MKGYRNISSVDAEQVLRYFSGKREKPDILITANEAYYLRFIQPSGNTAPSNRRSNATRAFRQEISSETPRKQTVLSQLRNRQNALHALGYDPDHIDAIKTEDLIPTGVPEGMELSGEGHLFKQLHGKDPYTQLEALEKQELGTQEYELKIIK